MKAKVQAALKYKPTDAEIAAAAAAAAARALVFTTNTLGGDTLYLRGSLWEDAWAAPDANLADVLVAENQESAALHGVYGVELDPVTLNLATMELSSVLFRPLTAVNADVLSKRGCGGAAPTTTLSVRLALEAGTVGYARHKLGVLVGVVGKGGGTHAGRLWVVEADGTKRKLRHSEDGELLQAVGVTAAAAAANGCGTVPLLYERHRTWKGLFMCAPKYEPAPASTGVMAPRMSAPTKQQSVEKESSV